MEYYMSKIKITFSEQELLILLKLCNSKDPAFYNSSRHGGKFFSLGLGDKTYYSKPVPLLEKLCQLNYFNKEDLTLFSFLDGHIKHTQEYINQKLAELFANKFTVSDEAFWIFIEDSSSYYQAQKADISHSIVNHIIHNNLQKDYTENISHYNHIHGFNSLFLLMFDVWKKIVKKIPDTEKSEPPQFLSKSIYKSYLSEMEANSFLGILSYYDYNKVKKHIDYLADKFSNNARLVEKIHKIRTKHGENMELPQIPLFQDVNEQKLYHYDFFIQHNSIIQTAKELKFTKDMINSIISVLGAAIKEKYNKEPSQILNWETNGDKTEVKFSTPHEEAVQSFKEDLALFQQYFLLFLKNNHIKLKEGLDSWQFKHSLSQTLFQDFYKYRFHDTLHNSLNDSQISTKKMKI